MHIGTNPVTEAFELHVGQQEVARARRRVEW